MTTSFAKFDELTSVHVNATDERLLVSGYTNSAQIFDMETASVVRYFANIHSNHINIARFTNHSPHLFGTSSFDKTVKIWDCRVPSLTPIFALSSNNGNVLMSFSPNDQYILTSAINNEVRQYMAVDGRLLFELEVPKARLSKTEGLENYTRAYYTASGRFGVLAHTHTHTHYHYHYHYPLPQPPPPSPPPNP